MRFADFVSDLGTVFDAANVTRAPVFGLSQGASVAVAYAAANPERVSALILVGGCARGWRVILAGEYEVLRDDAVRVAKRARLLGTEAQLLIGRRMQHDWPLTLPWLEESRQAWQTMCAFVDQRCAEAAAAAPGVTEPAGS